MTREVLRTNGCFHGCGFDGFPLPPFPDRPGDAPLRVRPKRIRRRRDSRFPRVAGFRPVELGN